MANTTKQTEEEVASSIGPRNFRHSTDIENFYRFVFENRLRRDALRAFTYVVKKLTKKSKSQRKSRKRVN